MRRILLEVLECHLGHLWVENNETFMESLPGFLISKSQLAKITPRIIGITKSFLTNLVTIIWLKAAQVQLQVNSSSRMLLRVAWHVLASIVQGKIP
jgi:hypothetical protein